MSGFEVLGAVAAAAQFVEQGITIVKLLKSVYGQFQDAPVQVQQRFERLEDFIAIAERITQTKALQTTEAENILNRCQVHAAQLRLKLESTQFKGNDPFGKKAKKAISGFLEEEDVLKLFDTLDKELSPLTLLVSGLNLETSHKMAESMQTEFADVKSQLNNIAHAADTRSESAKCLKDLFITDPSNDRDTLKTAKGNVLKGTCDWITQKKAFIEWHATDSGCLWISGGPGMGKTMLSIYLTDYLENDLDRVENWPNDVVTYFFCDFKDDKRNHAVSIIRGLLFQLLQQNEQLIDHILPIYDVQQEKLFDKSSFEALWKIFLNMVNDNRIGRVSCILDGLDECHPQSLEILLSKLRQAHSTTSQFRVVVVSREHPDCLQDSLGRADVGRIRLDPDAKTEINAGLDQYISTRVAELSEIRHYSVDLANHVKETLKERSNGTYLWVTFVVDDLRGVYASDVEAKLRDFPPGLYALYERMLQLIIPSQQKLVKEVLRWCTFAFRPLETNELVAALGVQPTEFLDETEVLQEKLKYCGHFLNASDKGVTLVHQSAYDFLTSQHQTSTGTTAWFSLSNVEAEQATLASECLSYLHNGCLRDEHFMDLASEKNIGSSMDLTSGKYISYLNSLLPKELGNTLVLYASRYWPDHFRLSGQYSTGILGDHAKFFSKKSPVLDEWLRFRFGDNLQSFGGLQHVAAELGLDALMYQILESEKGISWRRLKNFSRKTPLSKWGYTPLHRAVRNEHVAVAKMLIKGKAPVDARDWLNRPPLQLAVEEGRLPMVKMLVQNQAHIEMELEKNKTPLHLATEHGQLQVVEYLLMSGACINGSSRAFDTPLHVAARLSEWAGGEPTSVKLVKILLKWKGDPTYKNCGGRTALSTAASEGNLSVMRLFLDMMSSCDVNQRDVDGFTALHNAVRHAKIEATQLLLNHPGVDPDICVDRNHRSNPLDSRNKPLGLLDLALERGRSSIVRWLIDKRRMPIPEPSPDTPFGAVHLVFPREYEYSLACEVVEKLRFLISERNVDPQQRTWGPDYQTPLSLALFNGEVKAVNFLLDECNVDPSESCSGNGATLLHAAIESPHDESFGKLIHQLVIKRGINVNVLDNRQRTPLHYVLEGWESSFDIDRHDRVRILLEAGAQVDLKDSEGCTARELIPDSSLGEAQNLFDKFVADLSHS